MKWIKIDNNNKPEKDCMVYLEKQHAGRRFFGAHFHDNKIVEIGGKFAFDMPQVTHFMYPEPPRGE